MLHLFFGSDREAARAALARAVSDTRGDIIRITDAHTVADVAAALQGPGMFAETPRITVLDGIASGANGELREMLKNALNKLARMPETFFLLEGPLDAATKKELGRHATRIEQFDAPKAAEEKTIFALANALQRGDKKALWIGLMREYAKGSAPEAVHGLLFWGAKQLLLKARGDSDVERGQRLLATLAELPHKARRRGEDLSYALERFVLSAL